MTRSAGTPAETANQIPSIMATLCSYEGLFGPYHPQTLAVTTVLAVALCNSGSPLDGRRLLERAVRDLTKYHGKHHPVRLRALEAWSAVLRLESDWQSALPVQRELLECRTQLLGQDHPDSVAALDDLSTTLAALTDAAWSIPA